MAQRLIRQHIGRLAGEGMRCGAQKKCWGLFDCWRDLNTRPFGPAPDAGALTPLGRINIATSSHDIIHAFLATAVPCRYIRSDAGTPPSMGFPPSPHFLVVACFVLCFLLLCREERCTSSSARLGRKLKVLSSHDMTLRAT